MFLNTGLYLPINKYYKCYLSLTGDVCIYLHSNILYSIIVFIYLILSH